MTSNERMAPGHVYQPHLGTGIEWQPGEVRLWEGGQVTGTAAHQTESPYEFWYQLAFADCFPDVTHWWFRSAWTQRARLTRPQGTMDEATVWGYMQFVDAETPAQMWTLTESDPPIMAVPFPPNEVQPVNLPLRLALARLVAGVITDDVLPDEWLVITSLVKRDDLAAAFPTTRQALPWRLEGVEIPLREAFCQLQGLKRSC